MSVITTNVNLTPNECTEYSNTSYSAQLQADGLFRVQTVTHKDGKVTTVTQPTTYSSAALAKTAINLLTASYIDSL